MDAEKLANAFKAALFVVTNNGRLLYDKDVLKFSKATLIFLLKKQLEETGNYKNLPPELFRPFRPQYPSFLVQTPLLEHLDIILESMTKGFAPHVAALLDAYSPRAGWEEKRPVMDCEIQEMAKHMDAEMFKSISYTLDHLCCLARLR